MCYWHTKGLSALRPPSPYALSRSAADGWRGWGSHGAHSTGVWLCGENSVLLCCRHQWNIGLRTAWSEHLCQISEHCGNSHHGLCKCHSYISSQYLIGRAVLICRDLERGVGIVWLVTTCHDLNLVWLAFPFPLTQTCFSQVSCFSQGWLWLCFICRRWCQHIQHWESHVGWDHERYQAPSARQYHCVTHLSVASADPALHVWVGARFTARGGCQGYTFWTGSAVNVT